MRKTQTLGLAGPGAAAGDNAEPEESVVVVYSLSRFSLFVTPGTIARQAPLSVGFPRQEYCSRLPFPSPGHLPDPGIETMSPVSPELLVDSLLLNHQRNHLLI